MFAEAKYPEKIDPEELDNYLEQGWFRMDQTMFTTNFLNVNNKIFSAIWLRVDLPDFSPSKTQQKLLKQNVRFQVSIQKASLTEEKEALFTRYKQGISFEASSSLRYLLYGNSNNTKSIYDTYEVTMHDGDLLIAAGFFDIGDRSAAGINSFYDPAYKKYSLGKFLIYQKMIYCQQLGLQYFYPGYFVPGYSVFDYKLDVGKKSLQYLQVHTQQWAPIEEFEHQLTPYQQMQFQLQLLRTALNEMRIDGKIWQYKFFDANLYPDFAELQLFDFPLFLDCFEASNPNIIPVIVYDIRDQRYHWLHCRAVGKNSIPEIMPSIYAAYLLKIESEIFSAETPLELAGILNARIMPVSHEISNENLSALS